MFGYASKHKFYIQLYGSSGKVSKVMIGGADTAGNWFVDFKNGNIKYIVFRDLVLKYTIGNTEEKESVCRRCRELGIADEQMHWSE